VGQRKEKLRQKNSAVTNVLITPELVATYQRHLPQETQHLPTCCSSHNFTVYSSLAKLGGTAGNTGVHKRMAAGTITPSQLRGEAGQSMCLFSKARVVQPLLFAKAIKIVIS